MRVGISIGTAFSTNGPLGHRAGPASVVKQAEAAVRAGLDNLTVGDHHSTGPGGYVQNVPIIGRLSALWARQIGCLFLVPLWNPVLMAEQIGTLAAMSTGPFIVQTGLGGGREQFAAMGVDMSRRATLLEEGIAKVKALLAGDEIDGARVAPVPPDGAEWWVGGGVPPAIDRAARLGDCWYGNADLTPATAERDMSIYREACSRHGRTPLRVPIRRDVLISEDAAEAERIGDELVAKGYRGFDREAVAYGDPAGVAEQLSVYRDLGYTDIIIRTMAPVEEGTAERSVLLAGEMRKLLDRG